MLLKRINLATIFFTFCLILLGGLVHNTGSSLACPDWPLCFGQVFPKMEGGVLVEHSHRLLASLIGFLTIALVYFGRKTDFSKLTQFALVMVIFQGILGGITVLYKLPTLVSTTHLAISQIFFCALIMIDHKMDKTQALKDFSFWNFSLRPLILFNVVLVYLQTLLGAFLRHSGAGASCGFGFDNAFLCSEGLFPPNGPAQLHALHRYVALFVGIFTLYVCAKSVKIFLKNKLSIFLPVLISLVVIFQIFLGIMTVSFNMAVVPTTFHLGFACLLLGLLWKFYLTARDLQGDENYTPFENYLNLTKPKLTLLVIFSALIGLILSPEHIGFLKGALSIFAITLMVASAAVLNCFLEREIDGKMERTKNRSLPAKRVSPINALIFGLVLMSISLFLIFSFFNLITGLLGILSIVVYLFIYTPMKRKSEWAVLLGAIPGAIPPIMGYTSASGSIDTFAMVLFAILFIWQIPHFFAISIMYDKDYSAADILVFPNTRGIDYTNRLILKFSFLLLYVAMIPWFLKLASEEYRNAALVLSGILIYFAIKGRTLSKNEFLIRNWAKTYFLGTIFYIPFLFAALVFFK